jgi:hypothetical protein
MTRSQASGSRLVVARQIADACADEPTVVAVVCTGSTARGDADRWSDLELLVVGETVPSDAQRRAIQVSVGAQDPRSWTWDARDGASYDQWWHAGPAGHGLLVEVTPTAPADLAKRIDALAAGDAEPVTLTLGDAIVNGVSLIDRADVASWRARLVPYPKALAVAVVRRHGQIDHFWRWRMYADRDSVLQLQAHFADVAVRIVHVGCALSGVWWPGAKWLTRVAAHLPVAPVNLANRLERTSRAPPADAAAILEALVDKSFGLVAVHLPEVDVARLRAIFHFARRPF